MGSYDTPIPLSEIESVLGWVDGFKLSRPTKKINRDFSDAVLLAEILAVHYPKLVEMHNYPPRNSHSLKLNNWMTLNRKVLKKLKLNLCCNTMEQLANCAPKVIERVLVMVRDKIRRDIDAKNKDDEPNLSSGGSYYEALGDDEHVLVVPVKTRVNGVLETHQQKVVSYESYLALKEELKDAKDSVEMLKQKVEHVDNLLKLKEERIEELHKQLERKQSRRKEAEILSNSLCVPFDTVPNPAPITIENPQQLIKENSHTRLSEEQIALEKKSSEVLVSVGRRTPSLKSVSSKTSVYSRNTVESKHSFTDSTITKDSAKDSVINTAITKDSAKDSVINTAITKDSAKDSYAVVHIDLEDNLERIKSDVFEDIVDDEDPNYPPDAIEFKNIVQDPLTTIEDSIQREIKGIIHPLEYNVQKANYQ